MAGPGDPSVIAGEIDRLPDAARLAASGALEVFCAEAAAVPVAVQEIGRLRELAYRGVGEGTGRERDLDTFDEHYLHLFSWDRQRRSIVGAYRLGRTDRILQQRGVSGLYTRSLFTYGCPFLDRISPALELGRSFVRPEYQRNHTALLLLWKGIGQFVVRHPEYRVLFGAVSITARYSDMSKWLLMTFLEQNHLDDDLAALVIPAQPPMIAPADATVPTSVDALNRLVSVGEADGKGVPVLLRQYLKLNARLVAFNVDPTFGDALDALMTVDLCAVDPAILRRYFGAREADAYCAYQRSGARAA